MSYQTPVQESLPPARIAPTLDLNTVLVSTSFRHPSGRCGERVLSPHDKCQAALTPYLAAERFSLRDRGAILLCRCGAAWREVTA